MYSDFSDNKRYDNNDTNKSQQSRFNGEINPNKIDNLNNDQKNYTFSS